MADFGKACTLEKTTCLCFFIFAMHIELWTKIEFWGKNKQRQSLYIKQKDLFFQLKKETLTTFKGDQSINMWRQ